MWDLVQADFSRYSQGHGILVNFGDPFDLAENSQIIPTDHC